MTKARVLGCLSLGAFYLVATHGLAQSARADPARSDPTLEDYKQPARGQKKGTAGPEYLLRPNRKALDEMRVTFDEQLFTREALKKGVTKQQLETLLAVAPHQRVTAIKELHLEPRLEKQIVKLLDTAAHLPIDGPPPIRGGGGGSGGSLGAPPVVTQPQTLFTAPFVKVTGAGSDSQPKPSQALELQTSNLAPGTYIFLIKLNAQLVAPVTQHSDCDRTQLHATTTLGTGNETKTALAWMLGKTSVHEIPIEHEMAAAGALKVRIESTMEVRPATSCPQLGARRPAQAAEHLLEAKLVIKQTAPASHQPSTPKGEASAGASATSPAPPASGPSSPSPGPAPAASGNGSGS